MSLLGELEKEGVNVNPEKKNNLLKFASYLEDSKPTNFTMDWGKPDSLIDLVLDCFGSKDIDYDEDGFLSYNQYLQRIFIGDGWTPLKKYLFSDRWCIVDNTVQGLIKRIRYVCKNGLPETFDKEMYEEHPLSYKPQVFNPF